jgi:hypothetical protein
MRTFPLAKLAMSSPSRENGVDRVDWLFTCHTSFACTPLSFVAHPTESLSATLPPGHHSSPFRKHTRMIASPLAKGVRDDDVAVRIGCRRGFTVNIGGVSVMGHVGTWTRGGYRVRRSR